MPRPDVRTGHCVTAKCSWLRTVAARCSPEPDDYPTWLRWVVYTLGIMLLAALTAYAVIRAREIINYRRKQKRSTESGHRAAPN